MIDPSTITKFDRTDAELEEVLLFWILVAGKGASMMAVKLDQLLTTLRARYGNQFSTPFELLIAAIERDTLRDALHEVRMGKYTLTEEAFREVVKLDPRTATIEQLEGVPGIGPKTARCFVMHSRPGQRVAGLDTHVLKYLGEAGYVVPKTTPTGRRYLELEAAFLELSDLAGISTAELDLAVWNHYAGAVHG